MTSSSTLTAGRVPPGFPVTRVELTVAEADGSRSALPLVFHGGCRPDAERLAAAL